MRPLRSFPRRPRLRRLRPARPGRLAAVLVGVLAGAVAITGAGLPVWARVLPGPADVLVKALALDLAFGREPAEPVVVPSVPRLPDPSPRTRLRTLSPNPISLPPLDIPVIECDLTDVTFPKDPLVPDLVGRPRPGIYTWRQEGTYTFGGAIDIPVKGFTTRLVTDVEPLAGGAFSYRFTQSVFGAYVQVEELQVLPDDGIYLAGIHRFSATGEPVLQFRPLQPVRIVSLPIPIERMVGLPPTAESQLGNLPPEIGEPADEARATEADAGVDPISGRVMTIETAVRATERINACGEMVDGYLITGRRTFTAPQQGEPDPRLPGGPPDPSLAGLIKVLGDAGLAGALVEDFELVIAPHQGAMVVRERLTTVTPGIGPGGLPYSVDIEWISGGLTPRPLEDQEGAA